MSEVDQVKTAPAILLLNDLDNVVVAARNLVAGELIFIEDSAVKVSHPIVAGHKLARQKMAAGDTIVKLGAPIGRLVKPVECGDHVHTHNMESAYIPTHLRSGGSS